MKGTQFAFKYISKGLNLQAQGKENKGNGMAMKHFKTLLQMLSIKLILLSALAFVFLAMTAPNSSNKTETTPAANSVAVANSGTTRVKKEIE